MRRYISDLKLLYKLIFPAIMLIVAAAVTLVSAGHWLDAVEGKIATVTDADAVRLELALSAVSDLNLSTVASRDLRAAKDLEETERQVALSREALGRVDKSVAGLLPLLTQPAQRQIGEQAIAAVKDYASITEETNAAKLQGMRSATAPVVPPGGRGRVVRTKVDELLGQIVEFSKADMRRARGDAIAVGREAATVLVLGSGLAQLLALAVLAWIAVAQMSRPLGHMTDLMGRLAGGELDIVVTHAERRDEVGMLARALAVFKENAVAAANLAAEQHAEQRRKEARTLAIETQIGAFESSANGALNAFAAAAHQIRATSAGLSASAEESGRLAATVLAASEQASANVGTVAAATEQLSASVSEIGSQVGHAAAIAGKAVRETEETDVKVRDLSRAASRIGEFVAIINTIASQTNLLALNATIEADRQGDRGDHRAGRRHPVLDRRGRRRDPGHRRHHRDGQRGVERDRRFGRATGRRGPRDRPQYAGSGQERGRRGAEYRRRRRSGGEDQSRRPAGTSIGRRAGGGGRKAARRGRRLPRRDPCGVRVPRPP